MSFSRSAGSIGLIALVLSTLVAAPVRAEDAVQLRWKLKEGQAFAVTQTQNMVMSMNFNGQAFQMDMNQEMNMSWRVDEVRANGDVRMTQTIERVRMEMKMPNQTIKYDSAAPNPNDPVSQAMGQAMKPLIGATIEQTMDPRGKVSDLKIDPEVEKQMAAAGKMVGGGITKESLEQMFSQAGSNLPEKAIEPGATWAQTIDIPLPGTASMEATSKYVGLEDREGEELARIDNTFALAEKANGEDSEKPAQPQAKPAAGPQFDFKKLSGSGKTWFDPKAGRLVETEQKIDMDMSFEVGGRKADQTATVTTHIVVDDK